MEELPDLTSDWQDQTAAWLDSRAAHIHAVYTTPDKDTPAHVPLLLYLLEQLGWRGR